MSDTVVASRLPLRTWPATQAYAETRNRVSDLLVGRLALSQLSHTSQGFISLFFLQFISPQHVELEELQGSGC